MEDNMTNSLLRILAVDNDQLILWALEKACKGRELDVKTSTSVELALEEIGKQHFDLFLIDFNVRDKDQLKLLEAIDACCPYVPIIIMTTTDAESCELNDLIRSTRKKGAWHVLEKPFSLDKMISFIEVIFQDQGNVKVCLNSLAHNYDQEKRQKLRRPYVQAVNFSFKTIVDGVSTRVMAKGILTDISDSGSCLLAHEQLQPEQVISFEDEDLQHCGFISWSVPIEEETYRCGVQFC
jgi:DNA-binding NtrC family response regulator